ncbi:MAG: chemotaxis protein CheW [Proteobacteria bacterium]|nr:chemotaxis protein CheW [Pseudomonadota bacterium]
MDELLGEFLTETTESIAALDNDLVTLEQQPDNPELLSRIFRTMHTIKGTCGFIGLPRLEKVAHAGENVLGKIRDGELAVTGDIITVILECLDRIKEIVECLEKHASEPEGDDSPLIDALNYAATGGLAKAEDEIFGANEAEEVDAFVASQEEAPQYEEAPMAAAPASKAPAPAPTPKPAAPAAKAPAQNGGGDSAAGGVANQSIRVSVELLENLMTTVSELVLTRNQLLQLLRDTEDSEFAVPLQRLNHVTSELQDGVMKTRMQPIGNAWSKLPRLVRDLSVELGKKIDLVMIGEDTELDRQVLELIKDPLTHMVRNSADHGIESIHDRVTSGKSDTGTIILKAYHEGGHINISISDDGKGLNLDAIRNKAIESGILRKEEMESMSDREIRHLIFRAGFSTAAEVTSVSGRGVGMDVVRTNIEQIGGTIDLMSTPGKGTQFIIKIPLTLAIVSALIVESGGERFALPQIGVLELVRVAENSEHHVELINNTPFLRLRNRLLPLVVLSHLLKLEQAPTLHQETGQSSIDELVGKKQDEYFIIVAQVGAFVFGILVDQIFETQEIVVKPVSSILRQVGVFSGNTILGDGSVVMILDPNGILSMMGSTGSDENISDAQPHARSAHNEETMTLLLFKAGSDVPKAVPLALIARLEELDTTSIEHANGQTIVQYREALMPLLTVECGQQYHESGRQPVLVFSDHDRFVGLAVDQIIDIVEEKLDIKLKNGSMGTFGSTVIKGHTTEMMDVDYYIRQAYPNWFQAGSYEQSGGGEHQPHVLLVDDSVFFRNLFVPYLHIDGYQVTAVSSAEEALAFMEKGRHFDAILCDIEMEKMSGLEFATIVRQGDSLWKDMPIVALSGHATPEDMERGRAAGFTDYIAKHNRDAVLDSLGQILDLQRKGVAA